MRAALLRYPVALRQLAGRWHASRAQRWLQAWRAELLGLLPGAVRARLAAAQPRQTLLWPLPAGYDPRLPVALVLPASEVLATQVALPVAATADLHRVLGYEIDKYTPMAAEQALFTARVERQRNGTAWVGLVAIDRERLAAILDQCRAQGVQLVRIDALGQEGQALGVDLLPPHLRPAPSPAQRWNRRLAGLALLLLVTLLGTAVLVRQAEVNALRAAVAAQREQAAVLEHLRQALADSQGAAQYLAQLKTTQPSVSRVLAELGQCLGSDTWLSQLELRAPGELSLSGQSAHASALIGRARTCTSLAEVRFQGVIQPDPETGLDRFSLAARLHEEAADAPTPER